ncbi:MAG: type II secretion system protein F [Candidatus Parcubacteria bacterium]|nr:type II secretion system F family protein [Patescibacteria group bacterium]BCX15788.1 MAG: type II secretion system protein F [Candidatus Parcubacteria bacterium]
MAKFKYQARNKEGELQVGFVEAPDQEAATKILLSHDLFVLSLVSTEKKGIKEGLFSFLNRVKVKDLMVFTRQLATLMESEMPLDNALKTLIQQTKNPILKEAIFQIQQDVESGLALSQALERQKPIFSDFYVSMVRSAEVTGRLQEAMSFLADYVEKEVQWKSRITNAMIYPSVLLGLFLIVAAVMVAVVFPKIQPIFEESGVELPWISRALLGAGDFLVKWWWLVILVVAGLVFMVVDYFRSKEGKLVASQIILILPVFGKLFQKIYIARFSQSLSVLIKGGVPIAQAIEIAADTIGNVIYKDVLEKVAGGVREGHLFSQLLFEQEKYFPPMVGQMIAIGETTGRVDEMMLKVYDFYDKEVNDIMANLSELLQPILILVIGLFVGLLFASILLPIYNLAQTFKL